jgi:hypothetical protein
LRALHLCGSNNKEKTMGHSNWSDAAYESRQNQREIDNATAFSYDNHVRHTGVVKVHELMNPFGKIRESCDSDAHPESLSIAVIFDVTGSMGIVPRVLQAKLGALMRVLLQKGYVAHPQILFGAVGDAYCDTVPLQIGQFESGLEMDDELGKIYLEGGGGGQVFESYELAMYFIARHTAIDCFAKRGHKGYLFTIGDEKPYPAVSRQQVATLIGDDLQADLALPDLVAELGQRYEHFHIVPTNTYHGQKAEIHDCWRALLGERVLLLHDEAAVCETIALAIGICEGTLFDLATGVVDLVGAGHDRAAATNAVTALTPYVNTRPAMAVISGQLPPPTRVGSDGRL